MPEYAAQTPTTNLVNPEVGPEAELWAFSTWGRKGIDQTYPS